MRNGCRLLVKICTHKGMLTQRRLKEPTATGPWQAPGAFKIQCYSVKTCEAEQKIVLAEYSDLAVAFRAQIKSGLSERFGGRRCRPDLLSLQPCLMPAGKK